MLSPTLSKPPCSMPRVGTSMFKSSPRTFPKPLRNCISLRQSDTARSGRMSPGIGENSGRDCTKESGSVRWFLFFFCCERNALNPICTTNGYDLNNCGKVEKICHYITHLLSVIKMVLSNLCYWLHIFYTHALLIFNHLGAHISTDKTCFWPWSHCKYRAMIKYYTNNTVFFNR